MGLVKLINRLKQSPLSRDDFYNQLKNCNRFFDDLELEYELLIANGLPLEDDGEKIFLTTSHTNIEDEVFCIVDIETNGGKPSKAQIIEIGAIKIKNNEIIDKFESLVYAKEVPEFVTKVTELTVDDLKEAPCAEYVLKDFKLFLSNSVFVAHNVDFDYGFLSYHLNRYNLGELKNRKLCTIDLAKKTIEAPKYGLAHLNEFLDINNPVHHRAYADVLTTYEVMKISLQKRPEFVKTTEDLIDFTKQNTNKLQEKKNSKES
jgi:DNA polymerase-3 subunit epsilon